MMVERVARGDGGEGGKTQNASNVPERSSRCDIEIGEQSFHLTRVYSQPGIMVGEEAHRVSPSALRVIPAKL